MTAEHAEVDPLTPLHLVDWATFWQREAQQEWIAEPLVPVGRSVAVVGAGKAGKSLVLLDVAAAVATGRPILGQPNPHGPRSVLYLDYEQTNDDVVERLDAMGYGPDDDLSWLHYALLPSIDPLDAEAGGRYVLNAARAVGAEVVFIDTLARAVAGDENSADTYRSFYTCTGLLLKQAGVACVRADHTGHAEPGRARGSSAKADDVDVVWSLRATDEGVTLRRTHSRVPWVPETVTLHRTEDPLRHELRGWSDWPAGTKAVAERLERLNVPVGASKREAAALLRSADGTGARMTVVAAAQRYRRAEAERVERFAEAHGTHLGTRPPQVRRDPPQDPPGSDTAESGPDQHRNGSGPTSGPNGTHLRGQTGPSGGTCKGPTGSHGSADEVSEASKGCVLCGRAGAGADGYCQPCAAGRAAANVDRRPVR